MISESILWTIMTGVIIKRANTELLEKYGIRKVRSDYRNRKLHISDEMKFEDVVNVSVWGTGKPLREFMYSPDLAAACVFIMKKVNVEDIIKLNQHKK